MRIAIITLGWHSVTQRPHHWAESAVRSGHTVNIFTISRPFRSLLQETQITSRRYQVFTLPKNPLETILYQSRFKTIAKTSLFRRFGKFVNKMVFENNYLKYDVAIFASEPFQVMIRSDRTRIVYDCMDDWENFPGVLKLVSKSEELLANSADLVLAVSQPLYNKFINKSDLAKILLLPNGCDYTLFSSKPRKRNPDGRITIGYTGMITDWFDWDLVLHLAHTMPEAIIRLVGPFKTIPANLPSNIELLGRQPYEKMPLYNSKCDVCIIPFKGSDKLINSVSPIKLYEYLASGCPVVSVPMDDVYRLAENGVVHVANTVNDFAKEVIEAVSLSWDDKLIKKRRRIAEQHSWDARWAEIEQRLRLTDKEIPNS